MVSAKSVAGVAGQAGRLAAQLTGAGVGVVDVAWSLAATRSVFAHRAVVLGGDREQLLAGLGALSRGESAAGVVTGTAAGGGRVAWVFPGQGSQRAGMGRGLYERFPVFRDGFDQACVWVEQALGCPVREVILDEDDRDGLVGQTLYAQAGLFALGVGLAGLLDSWGMHPDVVAGHSVGEITAAYVAGVLSLRDAAVLVAARARLMQDLPAGGAMCAITAGEAEVRQSLGEVPGVAGRVDVAAVNGPAAVVVSGDEQAVAVLGRWWQQQGRRVRSLHVSHAFHSHRMDPVLDALTEAAAGLTYQSPQIPMVLAVTGQLAGPGEIDAGYWAAAGPPAGAVRRHRAAPAPAGCGRVRGAGPGRGVVCAGPGLPARNRGPAEDGGRPGAVFVPVLRVGWSEPQAVMHAAATAFTHGASVDWAGMFAARGGRRVGLPTYAFEHQRYWLTPAPARAGLGGTAGRGASAGQERFWAAVDSGDPGRLAAALQVSAGAEPVAGALAARVAGAGGVAAAGPG